MEAIDHSLLGGFTALLVLVTLIASAALCSVLVASWLAGWYGELSRRALAAVRRGVALRPGFGALHGTARPLDGRPGGLLVRSTITQVRTPRGWRDAERVSTGSPFALVLDTGDEVEIDPRDVRFPDVEAAVRENAGFSRSVEAHLSAGDDVWATGVLSRVHKPGASAYRSSAQRRRLATPRRGHVELSGASPLPRWNALAAAHRAGSYLAAAAFVLPHVAAYAITPAVDIATLYWEKRSVDVVLVLSASALVMALASWRRRVVRARTATLD